MSFWDFFTGKKGKYKQLSTLNQGQQSLHDQLLDSLNGQGAGGAFGDVADYYRNMLSNNPEDFNAFAAPELRRFNEEIVPGLAEQFAGMGSGNINSSGFRNAAVNAGTDLSERLGAIRANLRSNAASGLQNLGQQGLNPVQENVYEQGQPGLLDYAGQIVGGAGAQALGNYATNWLNPNTNNNPSTNQNMANLNRFGGQKVGKNTSPYGNRNQMPNFNNNNMMMRQ